MKAGHSKPIFSVRDIVDSNGAVVQSYEYDERGNQLPGSGAGSVDSAKTYWGGLSVNDDTGDSGLYLAGHRFFDPGLGRFLNRDPIGFAGGLNLYALAANNPISHVDPSGLKIEGNSRLQGLLKTYVSSDPVLGWIYRDLNNSAKPYIVDFDYRGSYLKGVSEAATGQYKNGLITLFNPAADGPFTVGLLNLIVHEMVHAYIAKNARNGKCTDRNGGSLASLEEEIFAERLAQNFLQRTFGGKARDHLLLFEASSPAFSGYVEAYDLNARGASLQEWENFGQEHWNNDERVINRRGFVYPDQTPDGLNLLR